MKAKQLVAGAAITATMGMGGLALASTASADSGYGGGKGEVTNTTTITKIRDDHSINLFNGVNVLSGNKTTISVLNGNKFLNNLGSGANIANVSTNLHNSVKVWTKVGNGNTGLVVTPPKKKH